MNACERVASAKQNTYEHVCMCVHVCVKAHVRKRMCVFGPVCMLKNVCWIKAAAKSRRIVHKRVVGYTSECVGERSLGANHVRAIAPKHRAMRPLLHTCFSPTDTHFTYMMYTHFNWLHQQRLSSRRRTSSLLVQCTKGGGGIVVWGNAQ